MKKLIIVVLANIIVATSFGQEFLGIKPDGNRQEVINKFIAKGFTKKRAIENVTSMTGYVGGISYEVNIVCTPISKKVWKFAVYLPAQTSWYSIKREYEDKLSTLKDKYGEPSSSYENFISPYYEGDGYEMSAVGLEKVNYCAFWDNGISIEISKFKQIRICYENEENSAINETEKNKVDSKVF